MRIYIVRHGQVKSNVLNVYNSEDEDLNDKGIEQANELKDKIKNLDIDIIISSPLLRTKHTTEIINFNNIKVIMEERIKERDPGDLSGQSLNVTNRDEYWNYNTKIQYGTSETMQSLFERVHNFLDELKTKDYNSVLIVAHSGVSKAFSAYFEGIKDGMFLNRGLKNCDIKEYDL